MPRRYRAECRKRPGGRGLHQSSRPRSRTSASPRSSAGHRRSLSRPSRRSSQASPCSPGLAARPDLGELHHSSRRSGAHIFDHRGRSPEVLVEPRVGQPELAILLPLVFGETQKSKGGKNPANAAQVPPSAGPGRTPSPPTICGLRVIRRDSQSRITCAMIPNSHGDGPESQGAPAWANPIESNNNHGR
jgi:hypothetical protein